jgi:steroid delta-isomerase-like uncharacterized protein
MAATQSNRSPLIPNRVSDISRRVALGRLGAAAAVLTLLAEDRPAAAQEATPPIADGLPPVLQEYIAVQEANDLDRLVGLHAEDAIVEEVPTGIVYEGRDAIRAYFEAFKAAFPDSTLHYTNTFATDTWATAEWTFSGTYTGQLPDFPPGEGQPLTIRGVDVIILAGDHVRGGRVYYDLYGFLAQLGMLPASGTPAA